VAELPHFDEIAEEYSDDVVVIAIHSVDSSNTTEDFVREKFNDSLIKFAYDLPLDDSVDMYFDLLGGTSYYPRTLVLDENGVITYAKDGSVTYGQLEAQIKKAMGK
jgi:thiol-disulfide isomerase/thioredoxin